MGWEGREAAMTIDPDRLKEIAARLEVARQSMCDGTLSVFSLSHLARWDDVEYLLSALEASEAAREVYRVQVEERYGAVAQWQAEAEMNRQAWLKAEARAERAEQRVKELESQIQSQQQELDQQTCLYGDGSVFPICVAVGCGSVSTHGKYCETHKSLLEPWEPSIDVGDL
jgi:hypothetical protein